MFLLHLEFLKYYLKKVCVKLQLETVLLSGDLGELYSSEISELLMKSNVSIVVVGVGKVFSEALTCQNLKNFP